MLLPCIAACGPEKTGNHFSEAVSPKKGDLTIGVNQGCSTFWTYEPNDWCMAGPWPKSVPMPQDWAHKPGYRPHYPLPPTLHAGIGATGPMSPPFHTTLCTRSSAQAHGPWGSQWTVGKPLDQMTRNPGPELAHGLGVKHPFCRSMKTSTLCATTLNKQKKILGCARNEMVNMKHVITVF